MGTWERTKSYASHLDTMWTKALGISDTEQPQSHQNPLNGENSQLLSLTRPAVKERTSFTWTHWYFTLQASKNPLWHSRFVSKAIDVTNSWDFEERHNYIQVLESPVTSWKLHWAFNCVLPQKTENKDEILRNYIYTYTHILHSL